MADRRRPVSREDALLVAVAVAIGLALACAFAAYRAVSPEDETASARLSEFGQNLLWPGVLIFGGIAAAVFAGWKANID